MNTNMTILVIDEGTGTGLAGFVDVPTPDDLRKHMEQAGLGRARLVTADCSANPVTIDLTEVARVEKALWPDEADEALAELQAARDRAELRHRSFSR